METSKLERGQITDRIIHKQIDQGSSNCIPRNPWIGEVVPIPPPPTTIAPEDFSSHLFSILSSHAEFHFKSSLSEK